MVEGYCLLPDRYKLGEKFERKSETRLLDGSDVHRGKANQGHPHEEGRYRKKREGAINVFRTMINL
jgi:hypothetical protein